ncbi:Protein FAR-RED IMPAIRED RESPONSE 1 [Frankliniella fusca]|uniref:Protein FAR-RED IMPAIRED RESPONSE 1 n=1 Tax=Frankliniella fusca TaxID=407009 RepID=A0AAE1GZ86_9NEOP|nr:Protein FAR-RED IMPAIRED RESPONSE 1 [Frankliniella fusca]
MESGEDDVEEVPSQSSIRVGATFSSWVEFEDAMKKFRQSSNTVFTIKSSKKVDTVNMGLKKKKYDEKLKYKSVLFCCKNFGNYTSKSSGLRPNQSSFKIGCEAFISVLADLDRQVLVIDKASLDHNHETSKAIIDFYPEVRGLDTLELNDAEKLLKLRVKPSLLLQRIEEETGKKVIGQDLVNVRLAIKRKEREGRSETEDLIHYLKTLEDDGDIICVGTDSENEDNIQFIFIMHKSMLPTFKKFPEVIIVDSTYNSNKHKMPLLLINAMNGLGGTECVAYAFLVNETKETYAEIFKEFRNAVGEEAILETKTVVVDHDMSEISSLKEVLPHVDVQLCSFHVPNSFKRRTKTEKKKEEVREILQKMIYSKTDEEYNELYESLKQVASSAFMTDYFNKYYHNCPSAWTRKSKSKSPNLGNDTTNRNESMNQKIKGIVDRSFELKECIVQIRSFLMNKANTMAYRRYLMLAKRAYVANCSDPEVQAILDTCTPFAAKFLRAELEEAKKEPVKIIYETTLTTCNCYFAKSLLLQCRHTMRMRAAKGLPLFSKDLISQRWLQSYNVEREIHEGSAADNASASGSAPGKLVVVKVPPKIKPKGKHEKYKSGLQLGGELAELLSICGSVLYEKRVSFIKEIIASWKNGQELSLYSKGPLLPEDAGADSNSQEEDLDSVQAVNDSSQENAESDFNSQEEENAKGQGSLKLPPPVKIRGKPKDCDRTVFTQRKSSKLKLPAVFCKGRPKTKKENRLTAIGSRRKIPGPFHKNDVEPVTSFQARGVLESESEDDVSPLKRGKSKPIRNQILSDSGSESDSIGPNILATCQPESSTQDSSEPRKSSITMQQTPAVLVSSTNEVHSDDEMDVKPFIEEKKIGFLEIDLVSDSDSAPETQLPSCGTQICGAPSDAVHVEATEVCSNSSPEIVGVGLNADSPAASVATCEATAGTSQADFSHLLNDDLNSIMLEVAEQDDNNPLCFCKPKLRTKKCVAGPSAKQPGRYYYACPKKTEKCKFWRLV